MRRFKSERRWRVAAKKKSDKGIFNRVFEVDHKGVTTAHGKNNKDRRKGCQYLWMDKDVQQQAEKLLKNGMCGPMGMKEGEKMLYWGEYQADGITYRAHPIHDKCLEREKGWHDFAMAKNPAGNAESEPEVPVQLLGYLHFDSLESAFAIPRKYNQRGMRFLVNQNALSIQPMKLKIPMTRTSNPDS